ncbi:ABC transporter ATP-binding protein [Pseudomonas protegens]|uniref:ABC-type dipeptide transporter n=1 Tax=Pseudomonas protegens TaxID=380021 RepID=A0A7G8YIU0_9PSED|nr:oligopeptide/dipeptide ABC transporter ATP-binding protein [Pseudomonas protegens]QNH75590.1 ABC transporter ATP-binding protein [Pseudomonas protegens]QNL04784.1 ABC transporter ATP-binding protein [Pseudomonas protegens]
MSLLQVRDLHVHFASSTSWLGMRSRWLKAVNGVSLDLAQGEIMGLVGESGSGKSSLGRAILCLNETCGGKILFDGTDITAANKRDIQRLRHETAMIFQDPYTALNPRMSVGETLREALRVLRKWPSQHIAERVDELLRLVGLPVEIASRKPGSLSGGQCQRVGIARALAVEPRLIVADECLSALDVSIQGQIINLLLELRQQINLTLLFISHDLSVVRRICDRVAIMYMGQIVEEGPVEAIFNNPCHPYTAALINCIPQLDPSQALPPDPLPGEPPSPMLLPAGCAFHSRCKYAQSVCANTPPPTRFLKNRRYSCVLEETQFKKLKTTYQQGV